MQIKKTAKILFPLLLGIFLCFFAYSRFTQSQIEEVKNYFYKIDYFYVYVAIFLEFLSHISRGLRWRFMLNSMGYCPDKKNMVMAVFIGYLVNLTIPRSGEISRALVLTKYDKIPFEKSFGSIISERVVDLIIGLLFLVVALTFHYKLLIDFILSKIKIDTLIYLSIFMLVAIAVFTLWLKMSYNSKNSLVLKIRNLLLGIKEGLLSVFKMENKKYFFFHTIFIWIAYFLMFYVVFLGLEETSNIQIQYVLTAFVVGSFAVAFTNGGFGAYPLFVSEVLFIFGVPLTAGTTLGWVLWASQTILVVIVGGISFLLLPVLNKNN